MKNYGELYMTTKYRKKPVEIEAMQFLGTNKTAIEMWAEQEFGSAFAHTDESPGTHPVLLIDTKEGRMECGVTDWIVKEPFDAVRGFYPVKDSVFQKTYEKSY